MGNPNCCFMITAVAFFFSSQSPRGTVVYNSTFGAQILDTKLETFLLAYFALSVGFLNRASSHVDSWLESQSSCFHNHTSIISRKFLDKLLHDMMISIFFLIEIINNKARHNLINVKYRQMAFRSARWRCSWEFFGNPLVKRKWCTAARGRQPTKFVV